MRSFSTGRGVLAAVVLQTLVIAVAPASAQDVVMRRPIPRDSGGTVGVTDPVPPTVPPEVVTPIVDPIEICDSQPGSPTPHLVSATWVKSLDTTTPVEGSTTCFTHTYGQYHCEAYYTCVANGENVASGGVVDDEICRQHAEPVQFPPS